MHPLSARRRSCAVGWCLCCNRRATWGAKAERVTPLRVAGETRLRREAGAAGGGWFAVLSLSWRMPAKLECMSRLGYSDWRTTAKVCAVQTSSFCGKINGIYIMLISVRVLGVQTRGALIVW